MASRFKLPHSGGLRHGATMGWLPEILIYTRHWIHYGALAFVVLTTLAAAAEGLLLAP